MLVEKRLPVFPCAFSYGGTKLENQFEHYRTVYVEGRGAVEILLETDQVRVGTKVATQEIGANTLTVTYLMKYESINEVHQQQRKLKHLLYSEEDVPIIFDDDPQIIYYGRLSRFNNEVEAYTGYFKGTFEIYCQDPLKYSTTKEIGSNITINSPVETTPEKIMVKMTGSSSVQIKNTTTGALIKITGAAIYAGNTVTFDFNKGKVFVNDVDRTAILDLESDFENFYIHRNDILTCTNGTMTVYAREAYM